MNDMTCGYSDSVYVLSPNPEIIPGGSFWLREVDAHSASFIVMATNLPAPASFDPSFTDYWYTIEGETAHRMAEIAPGVWWADHSGTDLIVPFPPGTPVLIQPGTKGAAGYPIILSGVVRGR